jgi:hypothetical protein
MKVTYTEVPVKKTFVPGTIQIAVETEEELRALYMIFNWNPLCEAKHIEGIINCAIIRKAINEHGDLHYYPQFTEFSDSIKESVRKIL